jgi:RNA polymerase sigma-70 factor (ECF subfamily)
MMIGLVAGDGARGGSSAEHDGFTALLEATLDPAYRLATVMLRDRTSAEDAVQEAALKAWRRYGQLRGGEAGFRAWFLSIVANECRMARRSRWWQVLRVAEPPEPRQPEEGATLSSSDLRDAVERLDPPDRAALFCFFYLDLPMEEVARVLGVSPSAARSRVYRAAARLRPGLDPSSEGLR